MPSLLLAVKSFATRCIDHSAELVLELDASENELSDEALARLRLLSCFKQAGVRLLSGLHFVHEGRPWRLRVLKLHKNKVGDDTCSELAKLLWYQAMPVEE